MSNFVNPKQVEKYIKKYDMQYFILLGMRSNGKSCAVRNYALKRAYYFGEMFFYLRRYALDMRKFMIESYFESVTGFDVSEITNGDFTKIKVKENKIFVCNETIKNGKKVIDWGQQVGYCGSLSDSEHLKSLNFPNCNKIIFEEFVTDKVYMTNETNLLFNLVSTVFRNNAGVVFLIGNTISEINPYFREFELTKIESQKANSIDIYENDNTKIAVWLTAPIDTSNLASNKMSFGEKARMIKNGDWDRSKKRHLERDYKEYNVLYTMVFVFNNKSFLMELLEYKDKHIWYISRKTSEVQKDTRLISDSFVESDICTIGFIPLNQNENRAFNLLKQGKIAYSDNLTGTQFIQCYEQMEKGIK